MHRLQLARIPYNSNFEQLQAHTKAEGEQPYSIVFPKYRKGQFIVLELMTSPSFGRFKSHLTYNYTDYINK